MNIPLQVYPQPPIARSPLWIPQYHPPPGQGQHVDNDSQKTGHTYEHKPKPEPTANANHPYQTAAAVQTKGPTATTSSQATTTNSATCNGFANGTTNRNQHVKANKPHDASQNDTPKKNTQA